MVSLDVDELAFRVWTIIFPLPRNRLNGEDALEGCLVSHASGAGFRERGTVGAGLNWQKDMLSIMELDQDSKRK